MNVLNWLWGKTKNALTWHWTKSLLTWLIISAGTMSECVFVGASLWICINASVHSFVLLFMPDATSRMLTSLADTAYVALPELILPLAIVTTISHLRVWLGQRKNIPVLIWLCMFGVPTLVFLSISVTTLAFSLASVGFELPMPLIIVRGISGYWYAIASILYIKLGMPQERDRLNQKDVLIETLRRENTVNLEKLREEKAAMQQSLTAQLEKQNGEIANLKALLEQYKNTERELINSVHKSSDDALQAYSEECIEWLKSGVKTVLVEDINRYTGISKRKIENAINKGLLQQSPRNKELILVSSLVNWLRTMQPITSKTGEMPMLHIVNG